MLVSPRVWRPITTYRPRLDTEREEYSVCYIIDSYRDSYSFKRLSKDLYTVEAKKQRNELNVVIIIEIHIKVKLVITIAKRK